MVQLGHLYWNRGDLERAEGIYRAALDQQADYIHAQAGMARILAARGQNAQAITLYSEVTQRLPLPEYLLALGELYEAQGRTADAASQYDLIDVIQQLNGSAGMNVDLELAWFNADHGDPALALEQAEAAYAVRPTIFAADALGWALYRTGRYADAAPYAAESLRLGTRDARLHFHAGMIAHALGDGTRARELLAEALEINPHFSLIDAPVAKATLAQIGE
jgi:tetratricopeptide (TPR) repeat protein